MRNNSSRPSFAGQQGFTLIEAVVATGILIVGLVAISNLMFVAISSNSIANWQTGSTFVASQKMEELRSLSFTDPALADSPADTLTCDEELTPACAGVFAEDVTVDGLGVFHTRWRIQTVAAVSPNLKFIAVQTEKRGPLARRTRVEFTTLRASR